MQFVQNNIDRGKNRSIECAKYKTHIHNLCALDSDSTIQSTNCSWHCPDTKCNFNNTSAFFSNIQININSNNIFETLNDQEPKVQPSFAII